MSFKIADLIAGVTAGFCAVSLLSTKRRRTRKDGARPDSLNERVRQIAEIYTGSDASVSAEERQSRPPQP